MLYRITHAEPHPDEPSELGIVKADSAQDAVDRYVEEQMPDDYCSAGWSTRDFLRYSLAANPIPTPELKPLQFQIKHLLWIMLAVGLFFGYVVRH